MEPLRHTFVEVGSLAPTIIRTGRLSALPPVTWSRQREFRLIRPLVYVSEELTSQFAASLGAPVIPCGCSQRTGTVRKSLRSLLAELEREHPHIRESLLSAMGNIEPSRLLDIRYMSEAEEAESALFPIVAVP